MNPEDQTPNNCLIPPPDGTPDREQYDRFKDFLTWYGHAKPPIGQEQVSPETWRYLMGENIAPTPPRKNQ